MIGYYTSQLYEQLSMYRWHPEDEGSKRFVTKLFHDHMVLSVLHEINFCLSISYNKKRFHNFEKLDAYVHEKLYCEINGSVFPSVLNSYRHFF